MVDLVIKICYNYDRNNIGNLRLYKSRTSLDVEQILTFASSSNLVSEVENKLQISSKLFDDVWSY